MSAWRAGVCAALLLATATVIGAAAEAEAATPFTIGNGIRPSAAVDSTGNGYFAWMEVRGETAAEPAQVHFCKVAAGSSACVISSTFPAPAGSQETGQGAGYPQVFLTQNGQPTVFTGCRWCFGTQDRSSQFVSTDGGASFHPRPGHEPLGLIGAVSGYGRNAYDAGADALLAIAGYGEFQRMPVANPAQDPPSTAKLGPFPGLGGYQSAVSFTGAGATQTQVAVFAGAAAGPEIRFKYHANPSDPNVAANWTGGTSAIASGNQAALATGPSGIVLLTARESSPSAVEARRFSASSKSFAPATTLTAEANGDRATDSIDVAQAPNGRLHALWHSASSATVSAGARYATSVDGVTWSAPQSIVADDPMHDVKIAGTTGAGAGWIVYANSIGADGAVRVARLDPLPVSGQPSTPGPPPLPQAAVAPIRTAAPKVIRISDRHASFSLSVPSTCVAPGQSFVTTLTWKRKKRRGNSLMKVSRVDFLLGSQRLKSDRKAPFAYAYKISTAQKRGSTIQIGTRVFTKLKRGKAPTTSLRAPIRICG